MVWPTPAPRLLVYTSAVVAGVAVLAWHAGAHHATPMARDGPPLTTLGVAVMWWTLMVIAMMFPLVADDAVRVCEAGLRSRRLPSLVAFLAGYLAVWVVIGALGISAASVLWPHGAPTAAVLAILLAAAAWQLTPVRRQTLTRCGGRPFVAVTGWRALGDCARHGLVSGRRCVITCGVAMLTMVLIHSLIVMVVVSAVLYTERRVGPNPDRRHNGVESFALVLLAGLVGWWSLRNVGPLP